MPQTASRRVRVAGSIAAVLLLTATAPGRAFACVAASPGRISLAEGVTVAVVADVAEETTAWYRLEVVDALVGPFRDGDELRMRHGSPGCSLLSLSVGERVALLSVNPDAGLDYFGVAIWHANGDGRLRRAQIAAYLPNAVNPRTLAELRRLLALPDTATADVGPRQADLDSRWLLIALLSLATLLTGITGRGTLRA
jgi:hypothetical protein